MRRSDEFTYYLGVIVGVNGDDVTLSTGREVFTCIAHPGTTPTDIGKGAWANSKFHVTAGPPCSCHRVACHPCRQSDPSRHCSGCRVRHVAEQEATPLKLEPGAVVERDGVTITNMGDAPMYVNAESGDVCHNDQEGRHRWQVSAPAAAAPADAAPSPSAVATPARSREEPEDYGQWVEPPAELIQCPIHGEVKALPFVLYAGHEFECPDCRGVSDECAPEEAEGAPPTPAERAIGWDRRYTIGGGVVSAETTTVYIHPCHACHHDVRGHHGLTVVDGVLVDNGQYPPPEDRGANWCEVVGCLCTDYTYPPWQEYPSEAAWQEAVRGFARYRAKILGQWGTP